MEIAIIITTDNEIREVALPDGEDGLTMLRMLQESVGGYIEHMSLNGLDMYVNEEGLLYNLPYNPVATWLQSGEGYDGIIVGNVIVTGSNDDGDTVGIPDDRRESLVQAILSWCAVWQGTVAYIPIDKTADVV